MPFKRQTLGPFGLSGLISVAERAPVVFLALMRRAWEQDPALAQTRSLSCGNKSSLKFSPPALRRGLRRRAGKFPGRDMRWLTPDECAGN
jgi:hypothetical protein